MGQRCKLNARPRSDCWFGAAEALQWGLQIQCMAQWHGAMCSVGTSHNAPMGQLTRSREPAVQAPNDINTNRFIQGCHWFKVLYQSQQSMGDVEPMLCRVYFVSCLSDVHCFECTWDLTVIKDWITCLLKGFLITQQLFVYQHDEYICKCWQFAKYMTQ